MALTSAGAETQPAKSTAFPDFDDNGVVDFADFLLFVSHFGKAEERYDLNIDGQVDFSDFLIFVSHFGKKDPRIVFNIDIVFVDESNFTEAEKAIIQRAARRWEEVIVGDLPDVDYSNEPKGWQEWYDEWLEAKIVVNDVIDDVRIFINNVDLGTTAGMGGPATSSMRTQYDEVKDTWILGLPDIGRVMIGNYHLNRARDWKMQNPQYDYEPWFLQLVTHEIGHVLGIGTLWYDFIVNAPHDNSGSADTHFTGPLATKAFDEAGGTNYQGAKVPVQNQQRDQGHWRYEVIRGEIMGGSTTTSGIRYNRSLSAITIQALADLGYKVDVSKADPYRLPAPNSKPTIGLTKFKCMPIIPKFKNRQIFEQSESDSFKAHK